MNDPNRIQYTVGIVTYVERFEKWFKPLLTTIKDQQPDIEVIVCVNGEHKKGFDQQYRKDILQFMSQFNNVYPMMFTAHRSLSKLWNTLLINSSNDMVLRIDDDLTISNPFFWKQVEEAIRETGGRSFKINGSWSHTILNRQEIEHVGWFDERLLGGGEEDGDMEWRWAELFGPEFLSAIGFAIENHWNDVDYEKCLVNMKKSHGKRSTFNTELIREKYKEDDSGRAHGIMCNRKTKKLVCVSPTVNQYPYERFFWENKEKL